MNRSRTLIFRLTGSLVLVLVLAAFALSYGAVYGLALSYGWPAWAAYASPLMLDFVVVVGKMDILRRSLDKVRTIYPWTVVLVFSGLAVLFNVLHVTPDNWTSADLGKQLFAALPPVVVLLAFHLFVEQVKARIAALPAMVVLVDNLEIEEVVEGDVEPDVPTVVPLVVPKNVPEARANVPKKWPAKKRTKKPAVQTPAERQAAIPALLANGLSEADLPGHFNVSDKTIKRDLSVIGQTNGRY